MDNRSIYKNDNEIRLAIAQENEERLFNHFTNILEGNLKDDFIKYSFLQNEIHRLKAALS